MADVPPTTGDTGQHSLVDTAKEQAQHAFEASRDAARAAAKSVDSAPLGVLVGGLAVGVLAATLIPRTEKEKELLAPVGKRLSEGAAAAVAAAKEAGRAELEARGLTREGAQAQVKTLLEGLGQAASKAGGAAADAARGHQPQAA